VVRLLAREPLASGDWLAVDEGRIAHRLERRTEIARRRPGRGSGRQVLAANVDLVLIVCGLDRPLRSGRIRRLVALARGGGADAALALTKADLVTGPDEVAAALTASIGLEATAVSASESRGLDALAALAAPDRTLVLLGESGAGKSTLVNALADTGRATGAVRGGDGKGRHTTTARELVPLPGGGALLDTPGLREVGLPDAAGLDAAFEEVAAVAAGCRFRDCAHGDEPGCAVRAAVAAGLLDGAEVDRMVAMQVEAAAADLRANEHERRRHERRFARMARSAQRDKRHRR
jgi:ribosome biogenesis GTPase